MINEFYDIHCHAHTLAHPSFLALLENVRGRTLETLYSQATSFNYLVSSLLHNGGEKLRNTLSVMENEPGDIFSIMEDDLAGKYSADEGEEAVLRDGKLIVGDTSYDKLILVPLLIDFDQPGTLHSNTYYNKSPHKPIEAQILDILMGIRAYRRRRPAGFLEICPFLGVNPKFHTPKSMEIFLDRWFSGFERTRERSAGVFESLRDADSIDLSKPGAFFGGIKLYPPLGFDPWPANRTERTTLKLLYSFCEKHKVPITTHCDDGGFRTIGMEAAWRQTDPASYRPALQEYPELIIDFAHFGSQYSKTILGGAKTDWRDSIIALMLEYPNIYTDISFNGVDPGYYDSLIALLAAMPSSQKDIVQQRIMFGSDFLVNLLKSPSYLRYFLDFSRSGLDSELKIALGSTNPRAFLFGD